MTPKHQGPLQRFRHYLTPPRGHTSRFSLQVPPGMAAVVTPWAGRKGSPHRASWVVSRVLEDESPKGETNPPMTDRRRETKYCRRNPGGRPCVNNPFNGGHVGASTAATGISHVNQRKRVEPRDRTAMGLQCHQEAKNVVH